VHTDYKEVLGSKLLKIENTPIEQALKMVEPVVPVENRQYMKAYGIRYLLSIEVLHAQKVIPELGDTVTLTLEKEGRTFTHTFGLISREEKPRPFNFTLPVENWLTARDTTETPMYLKHMDKYYYFEYLEDSKVVYVRQSSVFNHESESLEDFYKRLFEFIDNNEVSRLVYDVRLNGGGNNYNNLNLIKGLMARPKINTQGKFFFIIGRDTFSACQNLTNEIIRYTEAILVGEPTGENENFYGDNQPVTLPNSGITAYLSYAWWQDRAQWEGRDATYPHLAVEMSFADYVNNNDVVLKAALEYKDDGFILDPMQHLTQLFVVGDFEQLQKDASVIAKDERYRYYDFKEEFSKAGGRLQQQGNIEGALFVFQLVASNYPNDVGVWYNLAGVQKDLKQTEAAISSYKKIIDLDADHALAKAARKQIEKLKTK
jgi:tetratricopeptide (TPR) repeat protein